MKRSIDGYLQSLKYRVATVRVWEGRWGRGFCRDCNGVVVDDVWVF